MRLRVATYNVRGFRDGLDGVARVVESHRLDLLLLQETGPRHTLRALAHSTSMEAAADPFSPFRRRVKNAVLVGPPWRILRQRLHRFAGSSRLYPRGALIAEVGRAERRLWAVSIHLGLSPLERDAHVRELASVCKALAGAPIVIGGDLNARPGEQAPLVLGGPFEDVWPAAGNGGGETFPARDPAARIDYVFVSTELVAESASVVGAPTASDHLPVVAELSFGTL